MDVSLSQYLRALAPHEKQALADAAGTSLVYLYHVAAGRKRLSLGLADALVAASGGVLELRRLPLADDAQHQLKVRSSVREHVEAAAPAPSVG